MNRYLILLSLVLLACDGKLTDEQRKRMKEQMELHKIKRVTETEITEAAYKKGRGIMTEIEKSGSDSSKLKALIKQNQNRIRWIVPGKNNAVSLEQQLVDAYLSNPSGDLQDNVQQVRHGAEKSDSILYTKPVVTKLADGSERLEGIWNIWLSQKEIILAMDKK
jgi:hypothetical protein